MDKKEKHISISEEQYKNRGYYLNSFLVGLFQKSFPEFEIELKEFNRNIHIYGSKGSMKTYLGKPTKMLKDISCLETAERLAKTSKIITLTKHFPLNYNISFHKEDFSISSFRNIEFYIKKETWKVRYSNTFIFDITHAINKFLSSKYRARLEVFGRHKKSANLYIENKNTRNLFEILKNTIIFSEDIINSRKENYGYQPSPYSIKIPGMFLNEQV